MKTIHILSDEELAMVNGMSKRIEQLENENKTLREFNAKHRSQIDELNESCRTWNKVNNDKNRQLAQATSTIQSLKEEITLLKKSAASQAHDLLVKEAELAHQSQIIQEMKRDMAGTQQTLHDANQAMKEAVALAEGRLKIMNNLEQALHKLKHERFAVVVAPTSKRLRVVSMQKVDTFRKFGWEVLAEDLFADIPA